MYQWPALILREDNGEGATPARIIGWERTLRLPTPGVIVKSCLDECDACEPSREREIELELEARELENKLLQRKIDLLEKSQEYRCCPGEADSEDRGEADTA